jgi:hypothetical protein
VVPADWGWGRSIKNENPYWKDLQQLGIRVQQGGLTADANVAPRMIDQPPCMAMSVCAVMNCRWTGVMSLQVTTTNGSISDVIRMLSIIVSTWRAWIYK